jgi:hypothetical protein
MITMTTSAVTSNGFHLASKVPGAPASVPYKPGLHRPAVLCTPVGLPGLRTRRQVPPNQQPVPSKSEPMR